ncbi:hypothetical protein AAH978_14865 [Streptomyces sp. ZYX-F-203]
MSVDTRTPRTPTGDRSSGFDDAPPLSMVKVPSDPAQVIVNHASFRVQLGASARRSRSQRVARHLIAAQDTTSFAALGGAAGRAGAGAPARRRPVVWSGRSAPDDTGAHRLLQAVRAGAVPVPDTGATRVVPRVGLDDREPVERGEDLTTRTLPTPVVGARPGADAPSAGRLLPPMRTVGGAYDDPPYEDSDHPERDRAEADPDDRGGPAARPSGSRGDGEDSARHAYYPGRRMNLGVVLLPLRVVIGFVSVYAGMGKLCDPVYFDGGERGSLVAWLNTLTPWEAAEPLHRFALAHPVGSGLAVAFLQVIVGVLTMLGCWQRLAAAVGALLSAALLVTVGWTASTGYDASDVLFLAAWSPLIIAGAPVYSVDGRLAATAWRRLGPLSDIWDLRLFVLRRGALVTFLVAGVTLLVGSVLGGAVRDTDRVVVPGPGEAPRNVQPGSPLPSEPEDPRDATPEASASPSDEAGIPEAAEPSEAAPTPEAVGDPGEATSGTPSQTQGTTGQAPPERQPEPAAEEPPPSTTAGPAGGGGSTGGPGGPGAGDVGPGTGTEPGTGGDVESGPGPEEDSATEGPGLVGGLLG